MLDHPLVVIALLFLVVFIFDIISIRRSKTKQKLIAKRLRESRNSNFDKQVED